VNQDDSETLKRLCREASQEFDSLKLLGLMKKISQLLDQKPACGRDTDTNAQQKSA